MSHGILATAGIDYIAATGESTSTQVFLQEIGYELGEEARADGNVQRPFRAYGYLGFSIGGVSLGSRDDSTILRISGSRANGVGREICRRAGNVSRVDVQSTVRFSRDHAALARSHAQELQRHLSSGGIQRHVRVERTYGRGDTLYLGSRKSNYYGRVYDKYRESGDKEFMRCWRYEVECKDSGAHATAKLLAASTDVSRTCDALVHRWFSDRGLHPRYRSGVANSLTPIGKLPTDAERQLSYMRRYLGPLFRRLCQWYSEEYLLEVLRGIERTNPPAVRDTVELR